MNVATIDYYSADAAFMPSSMYRHNYSHITSSVMFVNDNVCQGVCLFFFIVLKSCSVSTSLHALTVLS